MRRMRIESHSHELIAGFVAGVEWVNDSALNVVDLEYGARKPFVVLEDQDGADEEGVLNLTINGIEG